MFGMGNYKAGKKASDVLLTYLKKEGIELSQSSAFFSSWESIAGERIASQSVIKDIKNNTVLVETFHPACTTLIKLSHDKIIKRIRHIYPELNVKNIRTILVEKRKQPEEKAHTQQKKKDQDNQDSLNEVDKNKKEEKNEDALKIALNKLKKAVYNTAAIDKDKK